MYVTGEFSCCEFIRLDYQSKNGEPERTETWFANKCCIRALKTKRVQSENQKYNKEGIMLS